MMEIPWWGLLYIIFVVFVGAITYVGDTEDEPVHFLEYAGFLSYIAITIIYFKDITESWQAYLVYAFGLIAVGYMLYTVFFNILDLIKSLMGKRAEEKPANIGDMLLGNAFIFSAVVPGSILAIIKSGQIWPY